MAVRVAALIVLSITSVAVADLSAAVRKRAGLNGAPAVPPLPFRAPLDGPIAIQLQHITQPVPDVSTSGSFYVGDISMGHPNQKLRVMFDTASGSVIVPHRACQSKACMHHQRYSPWESTTSMDVRTNGLPVVDDKRLAPGDMPRDGAVIGFTHADLGEGSVHAVMIRDGVCLPGSSPGSHQSCVDMSVLAAVEMDDVPFKDMPADAIVGLGLENLTLTPLNSFLGRIFEGSINVAPQFGISLHPSGGELYLGGYNSALVASPVVWLPVDHPEAGYWQVSVRSVRVGTRTVEACSQGCHAVVDTAASRLGVQKSKLPALQAALALTAGPDGCQGPELHFDLGDITITLKPEDYSDETCVPQLGSLNLEEPEFVGVYTFGEKVLRRYYAAFDWEQKRIGFAPAARSETPKDVIIA